MRDKKKMIREVRRRSIMVTLVLKIQVEKLMKFQQTDSNDEPSRSGWAGNKAIQVCIMILKAITALPDNKQTQRIE